MAPGTAISREDGYLTQESTSCPPPDMCHEIMGWLILLPLPDFPVRTEVERVSYCRVETLMGHFLVEISGSRTHEKAGDSSE